MAGPRARCATHHGLHAGAPLRLSQATIVPIQRAAWQLAAGQGLRLWVSVAPTALVVRHDHRTRVLGIDGPAPALAELMSTVHGLAAALAPPAGAARATSATGRASPDAT